MAVHKCQPFRLKRKNLLSPTPDACCPLLALRGIQLMTGEPRPWYNALQSLGESGACGFPRHRGLAMPACITARAWPLSDKKPMGFLLDSGRVVMHTGIAN